MFLNPFVDLLLLKGEVVKMTLGVGWVINVWHCFVIDVVV